MNCAAGLSRVVRSVKSGSGLIGDAEEIVSEMLEIAYNMFRYSMTIVIEKKTEKENIYEIDQKLNSMEIDVRKKILEHLSINPSQNITPSLVLVTLVVDIERLGDYSKNLVEVSHKYPEPLKGKYIEKIKDMELEVQKCFEDTIKIYNEQDEKLGKRVMEKLSLLIDECQDLLETLIEDESLKSREGIIYALLVRHLKRVSSHVRNVCSGIVNPFYRLGYKPDER
ncbi:MAG: PhoU domain-containing protein [candidate division WOR-3 bacterium]